MVITKIICYDVFKALLFLKYIFQIYFIYLIEIFIKIFFILIMHCEI